MTEHYSTNISAENACAEANLTPDSLTGMIFAMEGIRHAIVLLNGPMGCKFYHSTTSQFLTTHPILYLSSTEGEDKVPVDYNFLNDWFFRQSRVPCTYLDNYDYVYGAGDKVAEGLTYLREHIAFDLLIIVNSPGASLIGDNLKEIAHRVLPDKPTVFLESPGFSQELHEGHELAVCELLKQAMIPYWKEQASGADANQAIQAAEKETGKKYGKKPSINILGTSIWQRYHQGSVEELRRLLDLIGVEVNCVLCGGHDLEGLRHLVDADLNLVVYPELGIETARLLKEEMGMDYYVCEEPPIGFYAVEKMMKDLSELLGVSLEQFTPEYEKARAKAWYGTNQIYQMCGRPNGAYFGMEGMCSEIKAYVHFLTEYLGMIPDSLHMAGSWGQESRNQLEQMLTHYKAADALKRPMEESKAEIVLGNANTIARLQVAGHPFCGIEISLPGIGYTDLIPKTHMGITGTLFLVEQILNGLVSRI